MMRSIFSFAVSICSGAPLNFNGVNGFEVNDCFSQSTSVLMIKDLESEFLSFSNLIG